MDNRIGNFFAGWLAIMLLIGLGLPVLLVACGGPQAGGQVSPEQEGYVRNSIRVVHVEGARCVVASGLNGGIAIDCTFPEEVQP